MRSTFLSLSNGSGRTARVPAHDPARCRRSVKRGRAACARDRLASSRYRPVMTWLEKGAGRKLSPKPRLTSTLLMLRDRGAPLLDGTGSWPG